MPELSTGSRTFCAQRPITKYGAHAHRSPGLARVVQGLRQARRDGYSRARVDGDLVDLATGSLPNLSKTQAHTIELIVDRLVVPADHADDARAFRSGAKGGPGHRDAPATEVKQASLRHRSSGIPMPRFSSPQTPNVLDDTTVRRWRCVTGGRRISDVLDMDVQEALDFFAHHQKIARILGTLRGVGGGNGQALNQAGTACGGDAGVTDSGN